MISKAIILSLDSHGNVISTFEMEVQINMIDAESWRKRIKEFYERMLSFPCLVRFDFEHL